MGYYGVALDLGTSGFRGQAVDIDTKEVVATVITARHPIPGANVMDHLNFALDYGLAAAHEIVLAAVNQLIENLRIPFCKISRLAVCGNPIQISIFEEIEVRDLAYAGERKKKALGVTSPDRNGKVVHSEKIRGLKLAPEAEVYVPPAVRHEVGADALAMMVLSGVLEKNEIALVTDYGTNAEMALKVGDKIYTGSCAAGPALEGQHIAHGMLAGPGAIVNIEAEGGGYRSYVLDEKLFCLKGDLNDPVLGDILEKGLAEARGITGTGVIAVVYVGQECRLIKLPDITTGSGFLCLAGGIRFDKKDLMEAGKAIGALRAGYVTLAGEAGIAVEDIETSYMAGASGTYVDAYKAYKSGMVPPGVKKIFQIGNTSLALARELIIRPGMIEELQGLAKKLRSTHCMFGLSRNFANAYLLELSFWSEGMPWDQYRRLARSFKLPFLPAPEGNPCLFRLSSRDIDVLGAGGLGILEQVGDIRRAFINGCKDCLLCVEECPESALGIDLSRDRGGFFSLRPDRCNGTACIRCERICPEKAFSLKLFL